MVQQLICLQFLRVVDCKNNTNCIPLWGKTRVTSKAGNPFLPTRPACCLSFHAVLGNPIHFVLINLKLGQTFVDIIYGLKAL